MRILCFVAALLAFAAPASLAGDPESTPGLIWSSRGAVLTHVDAVSRLALPNERTVLLGYARYALSTSPDGELLASTSGMDRNVHLVNLNTLGPTWTIGPFPEQIRSTHWIGRRTLVAPSVSTIAVIDVKARTVRKLIPLDGSIVADASAPGRYVALVAPVGRIGALRFISITPAGHLRTIAVPAIRGGLAITRSHIVRLATPGLALSSNGKTAYVVARRSHVVAVDLTTGRAQRLALRADRTLQAMTKGPPAGWQRTSRLLGTTLVSTGSDFSGREYASFTLGGTPAGLRLTDLLTRRTRVAVPGVNQFRICGGLIVAARSTPASGGGVVALDRRGRPLWSQYADQGVMLAGCTRSYVYLQVPGTGVTTLAARSGAVLETHRGSAATVIELG